LAPFNPHDASASLRFELHLKTFNPNQPRVPAGNPDGGQWTNDSEGAQGSWQDDGTIIFLADRDDRRYSVDLREEESQSGHALREHVGKTDVEMLQRVRREQYRAYLFLLAVDAMALFLHSSLRMIS
jgi:hypothetical protein